MAGKRRWSLWPKRIGSELNGVSGIAGVGGTAMGIAGISILAGPAAIALTTAGAAIAVGAAGYAVWKAVPPVMRKPEDVSGAELTLDELKSIHPPLLKLAVMGPSRAGKTTLKDRLMIRVSSGEKDRTQFVKAHIVSVPTSPPFFLALLDGRGENYSQQFKIAEPADCLCIVIDHNETDRDPTLIPNRWEKTTEFLKQVRDHLIEEGCAKKTWIRILINKRDLWEQNSVDDQQAFVDFCEQEAAKWRDGNFAEAVTLAPHSNEKPNDTAEFMTLLKETSETT